MLEVKDLKFSYGDRKVLDGVSFKAPENSVISILGPNGVGKTTMLKCVCGFLKSDEGTVTIDDVDVSSLNGRELAKYIGYVPQKTSVARSTVFDSVLIGRRPYIEWNATKDDMQKTWNMLKTLGLDHLALRYIDEISGGELQKVQIARAIVQEPKILILDEPTNNLDISNQHMTMHTVINTVRARGMCTIMTMHDINLAVHYSDKLLFVKDGKVAAYGGPEIITEQLIKNVYGMDADVIEHKGIPFVIPHSIPGMPNYHHHHHHDGEEEHTTEDHLHHAFGESSHD